MCLKESDPDLLIPYLNQSLTRALDGMKELDGFTVGLKPTEGLQLKEFESVLHLIPLWKETAANFMRQILIALMKFTHKTLLKDFLLMR